MVLKSEQDRVKALLTEAITVLCKNGLGYKYTCCIQGLLGITLDEEDVFLVDLKETITKAKRPEPEQETNNQTSSEALSSARVSSPGGSNSRRRRRSGGSNGGTPAKRAARNEEPPSPDDVIVVKEESSESEMVQYFGSSGVGDDQLAQQDSYGMILQDSATFDGAGCSVWDSSSAQQAWPQQKMSEYESTQPPFPATSVCHLSPSQMSGRLTQPSGNLKGPEVCGPLQQYLVLPLMQNNFRVSAFRVIWMQKDTALLDGLTQQYVRLQAEFDGHVKKLPGTRMCLSALTATRAAKKDERNNLKIYPGVAYWTVHETDAFYSMGHFNYLSSVACKMGATLKLLLQPLQTSEKDLCNALFCVLKDSMDQTCVRKLADMSAGMCLGLTAGDYPLVRAFAADGDVRDILNTARDELARVKLHIQVEEPETIPV